MRWPCVNACISPLRTGLIGSTAFPDTVGRRFSNASAFAGWGLTSKGTQAGMKRRGCSETCHLRGSRKLVSADINERCWYLRLSEFRYQQIYQQLRETLRHRARRPENERTGDRLEKPRITADNPTTLGFINRILAEREGFEPSKGF